MRILTSLFATTLLLGLPLSWQGAASTSPASELVAARTLFFGEENVDPNTGDVRPDRFLLSWLGVATYVAAIEGRVVLLDAYLTDLTARYAVPGVTAETVAAAAPEYIFVGHGHWDHTGDAARIAMLSGATVVGTAGHCATIRQMARDVYGAQNDDIPCLPLEGAIGEKGVVPIQGLDVEYFVQVHSAGEMPEWFDEADPAGTLEAFLRAPTPGPQSDWGCAPVSPLTPTAERTPEPADAIERRLHAALYSVMNGVILYRFEVGEFSLVFQDSTGNLSDDTRAASGVLLRDALAGAFDDSDVLIGAGQSFAMFTNCGRDLLYYFDALEPRVHIASHHDYQEFPLGQYARDNRPMVEAAVAKRPGLCLIYPYDPDDDPATPNDFLNWRITSFEPADPKWTTPASCAELTSPLA